MKKHSLNILRHWPKLGASIFLLLNITYQLFAPKEGGSIFWDIFYFAVLAIAFTFFMYKLSMTLNSSTDIISALILPAYMDGSVIFWIYCGTVAKPTEHYTAFENYQILADNEVSVIVLSLLALGLMYLVVKLTK